MKIFRFFLPLFITLIGISACTSPPVEEESDTEINVIGLYPGSNDNYTILVSKSIDDPDSYGYIDSILFIQIDTSGNEITSNGVSFENRPFIRDNYLLNDGNIMLFGNTGSYFDSYNFSTWVYTPAGVLVWEMNMAYRTNGVIPAQNGDLFVMGWEVSASIYNDLTYARVEQDGDTLWSFRVPQENSNTILRNGTATSDNGCIAIGDNWHNDRSTDILVARIDVDGDTLWTGTYGGDGYDGSRMVSELSDGSILVVGDINIYDSTNTNWGLNSGQQIYLIKLSENGDKLWTKAVGNTLRESANAIIEASDGCFVLCGTRDQSYVYLFDETTGWISKLSANGDELWIKEFENKIPVGVRELPNEDLLVVTRNLNEDYYYHNADDLNIMKLTSSGTLLWSRVLTP